MKSSIVRVDGNLASPLVHRRRTQSPPLPLKSWGASYVPASRNVVAFTHGVRPIVLRQNAALRVRSRSLARWAPALKAVWQRGKGKGNQCCSEPPRGRVRRRSAPRSDCGADDGHPEEGGVSRRAAGTAEMERFSPAFRRPNRPAGIGLHGGSRTRDRFHVCASGKDPFLHLRRNELADGRPVLLGAGVLSLAASRRKRA